MLHISSIMIYDLTDFKATSTGTLKVFLFLKVFESKYEYEYF